MAGEFEAGKGLIPEGSRGGSWTQWIFEPGWGSAPLTHRGWEDGPRSGLEPGRKGSEDGPRLWYEACFLDYNWPQFRRGLLHKPASYFEHIIGLHWRTGPHAAITIMPSSWRNMDLETILTMIEILRISLANRSFTFGKGWHALIVENRTDSSLSVQNWKCAKERFWERRRICKVLLP